ncbi:hypothetical protein GCM10008018_56220 [Paenibacillus marchantiophytorum]|uniref:Reverse transcriptase domain-containing protein n=1 Tax=Paenibacillus marchantiophytorum TaxID=1619310 RepID=A0ABQ1F800_9BACL|nr:reverse transcriptase domain-containing protein [Paenibacillus marchantiophytorum]GGA02919.1 hypothetical protein GCM10008018_56220 [Paenibacillus marchantiophytorum]
MSDRRVLKLIWKWLKAGFVKDDQFYETELGVLVRFADDLVILCKIKEQAMKAIDVLKAVFNKLEIEINTSKSKLVNLWGDKTGTGTFERD